MKIGLAFRDMIPQPVLDALDHMWATIAAGYHAEHNSDDTHKDVHADSLVVSGDIVNPDRPLNYSGKDASPRGPIAFVRQVTIQNGVGKDGVSPIFLECLNTSGATLSAQQTFKVTQPGHVTTRGHLNIDQTAGHVATAAVECAVVPETTIVFRGVHTWNNAATNYRGLLIEVTNTASLAASSLIQVLVDSAQVFRLKPDGDLVLNTGTIRRPDDAGDAAVFGNGLNDYFAGSHKFQSEGGALIVEVLASPALIRLGASGPQIRWGSGSPESVVSAPVGSTFHRTDGGSGTSLYVKSSGSGNTGWEAVTTS